LPIADCRFTDWTLPIVDWIADCRLDWRLGIGDWRLSANPQSTILSPISNLFGNRQIQIAIPQSASPNLQSAVGNL
jgi:hypothetical protein